MAASLPSYNTVKIRTSAHLPCTYLRTIASIHIEREREREIQMHASPCIMPHTHVHAYTQLHIAQDIWTQNHSLLCIGSEIDFHGRRRFCMFCSPC